MLRLASEAGDDPLLVADIGLCYEAVGDHERAEEALRQALAHDPTYLTRYGMSALYFHDPVAANVHHALARVLQRRRSLDEARLHYHLAKRIDPTIELDPMYLVIMTRDDLENHPMERQRPGHDVESPSGLEQIAELLRIEDASLLAEVASAPGAEALRETVIQLVHATQRKGDLFQAARLRLVGDYLHGQRADGLFQLLASSAGRRLLELAALAQRGEISLEEAVLGARRVELDDREVAELVRLGERFVALDPATALPLAHVAEAAAKAQGGASAALGASHLG